MAVAPEAPAQNDAEGLTSHTPTQLEALALLREPFQASQVSKLPKIWCSDCSQAQYKVCTKHEKTKCDTCSSKITTGHMHLDYVGHANLTERLLEADPLWFWEPLAFGPDGLPKFDSEGGLWIRLTVAGHTRLGYGDSQGKRGPNAVKEAIGDALRNAAMRFGAALKLWAKTDKDEADAEKAQLTVEPSRDELLAGLHTAMQKRWGHLPSMRALKVQVGEENFAESLVADERGAMRKFGELIDERILSLIDGEKREKFLQRVRQGWGDVDTVEAHLVEARTKGGWPDHLIPYGTPPQQTRLEDALVARLAALRNPTPPPPQNTGAAAAAQVAAEHGIDPLDQLMGQVQQQWEDTEGLMRVVAEAGRRNQLLREVEGPVGDRMPLGDLLTRRIAELKSLAAESDQNAHADVHERAGA